jgi:hypothetical protein
VITGAKRWILKNDKDPLAAKQAWYCPSCGAKYRPKYGLLCELFDLATNLRSYALADFHEDFMDVKSINLEAKLGSLVTSPEDLYKAVPEVFPVSSELIRPLAPGEYDWRAQKTGSFKVLQYDLLAKLPRWSWDQLWRFAKQ